MGRLNGPPDGRPGEPQARPPTISGLSPPAAVWRHRATRQSDSQTATPERCGLAPISAGEWTSAGLVGPACGAPVDVSVVDATGG
jgi:hypothetical protein